MNKSPNRQYRQNSQSSRSPTPSPRNSRSPTPNYFSDKNQKNNLQNFINIVTDEYVFYFVFLISSFVFGIVDSRLYVITIGCFIEFLRDNSTFYAKIKNNLLISYELFSLIFYVFLCINFNIPAVSAICYFLAYYFYINRSTSYFQIAATLLAVLGIYLSTYYPFFGLPISIFIFRYFFRNKEYLISQIDSAFNK